MLECLSEEVLSTLAANLRIQIRNKRCDLMSLTAWLSGPVTFKANYRVGGDVTLEH